MKHSDFMARVARIERELGQLINEAHDAAPPTVEWVAMLAWASCARGSLMGLAELGIPDSVDRPLETEPAPPLGCGCAETYPQVVEGTVSHGPGCTNR